MVRKGTENLSHHRIEFVRGYDDVFSRYWPRSLPGAFISCVGGLSSQVQHFFESNFIGCFPAETFPRSEVYHGYKPSYVIIGK